MGGDDSLKLLPWRGSFSSPGRSRPPDQQINTVMEMGQVLAEGPSATGALGHFWKVAPDHFWKAPKFKGISGRQSTKVQYVVYSNQRSFFVCDGAISY